jgi:UDP:flavonoid glycosyltransferase YjiC (YdhE family)
MGTILFATWDGGGNVPPALGIAAELARRGHTVRFIGHETQREAIGRAGHDFTAYPTAAPFSSLESNSPPRMMALFSDRQMGNDVLAELDRRSADVVVVDCLLAGITRACATAGVTYVSLEHMFDGFLRKAWARGPMGVAARAKGLRPVRSWEAADLAIAATLPSLDPGHAAPRKAANLRWTGPVLDLPAPHDLAAHEPAVLVSLSTYNFPGMGSSLQNILDATAALDARVVVTTGPAIDPADLRTSANHEVHRCVPHDELMGSMSLVVGHGGHATTMRAFAHDLPVVVMPMHPFLDQPVVGKAVTGAGAGAMVAKDAGPEKIRPVVEQLLADGSHRRAAARLGAEIRRLYGTRAAADLVAGLVRNGAPAVGA